MNVSKTETGTLLVMQWTLADRPGARCQSPGHVPMRDHAGQITVKIYANAVTLVQVTFCSTTRKSSVKSVINTTCKQIGGWSFGRLMTDELFVWIALLVYDEILLALTSHGNKIIPTFTMNYRKIGWQVFIRLPKKTTKENHEPKNNILYTNKDVWI